MESYPQSKLRLKEDTWHIKLFFKGKISIFGNVLLKSGGTDHTSHLFQPFCLMVKECGPTKLSDLTKVIYLVSSRVKINFSSLLIDLSLLLIYCISWILHIHQGSGYLLWPSWKKLSHWWELPPRLCPQAVHPQIPYISSQVLDCSSLVHP